jgi:hypothetical protein
MNIAGSGTDIPLAMAPTTTPNPAVGKNKLLRIMPSPSLSRLIPQVTAFPQTFDEVSRDVPHEIDLSKHSLPSRLPRFPRGETTGCGNGDVPSVGMIRTRSE